MDIIPKDLEPEPQEVRTMLKARRVRRYTHKARGDKRSAMDEAENAAILLAWEMGLITEGQVMRVLGVDRIQVRDIKLRSAALGQHLAHGLWLELKNNPID